MSDETSGDNVSPPAESSPAGYVLTPEEQKKRKQRNAAIALGLLAFIVLVFLVTIFRIGGDIASRSF